MLEIYTKPSCPVCNRTKAYLTEKQIVFVEHQIGTNVTRDEVLTKFPNAKMVPIIILNGTQIGGFNDLQLLMENTG